MNKDLSLSIYLIQHPTLNRTWGAQHKAAPSISGSQMKRIILKLIVIAKEVAGKMNMPYGEMIHYLNGRQINPDEILNMLPDEDYIEPAVIESPKLIIAKSSSDYFYESKTCAY